MTITLFGPLQQPHKEHDVVWSSGNEGAAPEDLQEPGAARPARGSCRQILSGIGFRAGVDDAYLSKIAHWPTGALAQL